MITNDPKLLGLALISGIIPSLFWLWFWLHEDKQNPEPKGVLTLVFVMGALAVVVVLPIQKFIQAHVDGSNWELIGWAATEEIIKFLAVAILLYKTREVEEAIDWPIYLITVALGFAALENALFLLKPITLGETTVGLLTGHLRFLGSTLLHTVASGTIGISLGLALHLSGIKKKIYLFLGIILAVALHSTFNFFIIKNDGVDFLKVFAFLWVAAVIIMLIFEKLRRIR
jgi:RsiW-degrading membrane proteinase PrsW (M82 family)